MSTAAGPRTFPPSADVMRLIAHEVRQPLSTIESIVYYLSLVTAPDDEKILEQLNRIQRLVEQANWILTTGLHLTEPLVLSVEPFDLEQLITYAVSSRFAAHDAPVILQLAGSLPLVTADLGFMKALFENLLGLFSHISPLKYPVTLQTAATGSSVSIEMRTDAPGYRSETALGPGSAISIESARKIAEAHGGTLNVEVDPASGVRLRLHLPVGMLP